MQSSQDEMASSGYGGVARGAVLLGTGGGGDPYVGELFVREQIRGGRFPKILSCDEIGGPNSMFPLALGAISGIPVLDADGVGRAVPHIEMTTFSIYGCKATPAILMDDSGNVVTIEATDDRMAEDLCRVITGAMGASSFGALYPMTGKVAVQRTITQTLEIGRTIRQAREGSQDIFQSLIDYLNSWSGRMARILFDGKIVDVTHETRDGWHFGRVTMTGLRDSSDECVVEIQNEFLVYRLNGRTITIVPDLISILDRESGEPLTAEMLSYGQRVKVVGYSADPMLVRPESLEVLGPAKFGIDEPFMPLADL